MKREIILFIFILFFISSVSAMTNISYCGSYTTDNEDYVINQTFIPNSTSVCLDFNADNITINGNGYNLTNDTFEKATIRIQNSYNVTLKNMYIDVGNVSGGYGVYITTGNNILVYNNTFNGNYRGVRVDSASNVTLLNNIINYSGLYGIDLPSNSLTNLMIDGNIISNGVNTGINVVQYMNNITIRNNLFRYNTINTRNMILFSGGANIYEISNNTFYSNTQNSAISISSSTNGEIFNNTFYSNDMTYSIHIDLNTNNTLIYNNNITCGQSSDSNHGITLRSSYNISVYNTNISNCSFGLLFHNGSRHNIFYDLYLNQNVVGLYFIDTSINNTAHDITINGGYTGVSFYHYLDRPNDYPLGNTLYDLVLTNNNVSFLFNNTVANANLIRDVNISGSINYSLLFQNSTDNVLLNVTYSLTESVDSDSNFTRKWYYTPQINDGSGGLSGASLSVYDNSSSTVGSYTTDSFGAITTQNLTEYHNIGGTRNYLTSYTYSSTKSGYDSSSGTFNLTSNLYPIITLSLTSSDSSSSGGGYPTFSVSSDQVEGGVEKILGNGYRVNFKVGGNSHILKVNNVYSNKVSITVSSNPITFDLEINESRELDLDGDGSRDLLVVLKSIVGSKAKILMKTIKGVSDDRGGEEGVGDGEGVENGEEPSEGNYLWLVILVLIVLIGFVGYKIYREKIKK